ncbi:amidohydrolase family protein [Neorhizobium galegae]|uniref:amidohydrolase family protein n=1 Tax=Neorhizobium galegae TaxID=399 RepID=UPI0006222E07|nr:amidohydrolase family protein [Neorhizobium galegae]MCQ1844528.1 amidohydrolase family protein [Neorhizobium galegae]CDZ32895.1 5-methylthioadenosine/S-adenosylhomocysteine deaminase [Neorhizobium galegae bv. officinalis]
MTSNEDMRFLQYPGREKALRGEAVRAALPALASTIPLVSGDLILPMPVNAHDHGYGIRTLDFGSLDDALETWIPTMRLRPRTDAYLEALVAFGRLAKTGVAATIHCHNSLNAARMADEALEVIRAAKDVGIRLGLSCPLLDHDAWAYDGGPERLKPFLSPTDWEALSPLAPRYAPFRDQLAAADAVAAANTNPLVDVQYGPIGPQWCSNALLEAIAEASAANNRRIHMHLLESPRQRAWLDRRFPQGIVRYLDDIGFLSSRLAVAHGVQLRPDEYELLAERGVQLVSNPSANLRLRSGIAPLAEAAKRGLRFGIGLDGGAFDDDQDLWREMRLLYFLHGGRELERDFTAANIFDAAIRTGATVVNAPLGEDFTVIDYGALIADSVFDDLDEAEVLLNRMSAAHAKAVYVAGRPVMRDRRLVNVDFDAARKELLAQAKADLPRLAIERERCRKLIAATRAYYGSWPNA